MGFSASARGRDDTTIDPIEEGEQRLAGDEQITESGLAFGPEMQNPNSLSRQATIGRLFSCPRQSTTGPEDLARQEGLSAADTGRGQRNTQGAEREPQKADGTRLLVPGCDDAPT